jgi:aminoglycoside phosphotransferase family enzyme
LKVIAIKGSAAQPRLGGGGKTIAYAVKMREFPQHCLLSVYATEQRLEPAHIDSIADVIANFHALAERADSNSTYGSIDIIMKWSRGNFDNQEPLTMDEQAHTNAITCSHQALSSEQLRWLERMITDSDLS